MIEKQTTVEVLTALIATQKVLSKGYTNNERLMTNIRTLSIAICNQFFHPFGEIKLVDLGELYLLKKPAERRY